MSSLSAATVAEGASTIIEEPEPSTYTQLCWMNPSM
ncbi:hypothetical protein X011_08780 [Mycobacterium tuberculosis variant microti OV254]|nr:hypothetical protein X011_08780 [Mycobacterium tuberculosis variant microti OV254]